jgi:hypothetical protein
VSERQPCLHPPLSLSKILIRYPTGEKDPATDQNTILFDVDITCTRKSKPGKGPKGKASAGAGAEPASASQGARPYSISYPR